MCLLLVCLLLVRLLLVCLLLLLLLLPCRRSIGRTCCRRRCTWPGSVGFDACHEAIQIHIRKVVIIGVITMASSAWPWLGVELVGGVCCCVAAAAHVEQCQ
jgi:hypothetical protein